MSDCRGWEWGGRGAGGIERKLLATGENVIGLLNQCYVYISIKANKPVKPFHKQKFENLKHNLTKILV